MKNVQIPYELFVDLVLYHLNGEDDFDEEIRQGLERKLDAMLNRQLYSQYKTAPQRRSGNRQGRNILTAGRAAELPLDYFSLGAIIGACHAPMNGRQGKVLGWHTPPAPPGPIEKSVDFEMDVGGRIGANLIAEILSVTPDF